MQYLVRAQASYQSNLGQQIKKLEWAGARLLFIGGIAFGVITGVGLYLLAPAFSYWFFGTLKFWKYAHMGPRLIGYAYKMAFRYLKGEFAPYVSLTAPPLSKPDLSLVQINPTWQNGESCSNCGQCCQKITCPLLMANGQCMGYDTFYWRYFNCGRYPTTQREIDHYECPKWMMRVR